MGGYNNNNGKGNAIIIIAVILAITNSGLVNAIHPDNQDTARVVSLESAPKHKQLPSTDYQLPLAYDCYNYFEERTYPLCTCCTRLGNEAAKYAFDPKETARIICDTIKEMNRIGFEVPPNLVFRVISRSCQELRDIPIDPEDCDITSMRAIASV